MLMYKQSKKVLTALAVGLAGSAAYAEYFCPEDTHELILAIQTANTNNQDDEIDLRGKKFRIQAVHNVTNGNNGLPAVLADNNFGTSYTLSIKNGLIELDLLVPNLRSRHFYVAPGASLYLEDVLLRFGKLPTNDGSLANSGGSILNCGSLSSNEVAFAYNQADSGGAIYNGSSADCGLDAVLTIANNTFNHNTAVLPQNIGMKSLLAPSGANVGGGAIDNEGVLDNLYNSTFNKNTAANYGGAILNGNLINSMTNNTIAGNTALEGGGIYTEDDGDIFPRIISFVSNIVATNTSIDESDEPDIDDDGTGAIISASYNLIGSSGGHNISDGIDFNQINPTPLLGPLQYNGGKRWTMALSPLSTAINAGDNPLGLAFDERGQGYLRDRDQTDIGAYELQGCAEGCDVDRDGVCCDVDNCPSSFNPDQKDRDHDGVGDVCDRCTHVPCPCPTCECPPGRDGCDRDPCDGDHDDDGDCDHDDDGDCDGHGLI
jgi:predicted outer membrane repeat protein